MFYYHSTLLMWKQLKGANQRDFKVALLFSVTTGELNPAEISLFIDTDMNPWCMTVIPIRFLKAKY